MTFKNLASLESHKTKDKQKEDISKSDKSDEEKNPNASPSLILMMSGIYTKKKIIEGETLYVCNLCDYGFESIEDVKKHIVNYHQNVFLQLWI